MKKFVCTLLAAALLSASLAACAANGGAVAAGDTDRDAELYSMVVFQKGSEYFNWCYAGMLAAAKAIGSHVTTELQGPAETDASLEAKTINQLLAKNPSGILVAAADGATLTSAIDGAIDMGVPVIAFDSDSPDSKRLTYLGTDNYSFGATAADFIAEQTGGVAEVAIVYIPGFVSLEERAEGFAQRVEEAYPGINIVAYLNEEGDTAKAEQVCTAQLQSNPEINAIFATGGTGGAGAAAAVRTVGRQADVTVVASDFGSATLELLASGDIQATVIDDPYMMGYQAMLMAYAAAHPTDIVSANPPFGHVPSSDILFGCSLLTTADINQDEVADKYNNPPTF